MPRESWLDYLIKDEDKAIDEYSELAAVLKKMGYRKEAKLVEGIARDEEKHRNILIKIRDSMK